MMALIVVLALCAFVHARTGILLFVGVAITAILLLVSLTYGIAWAAFWAILAAVVFPVLRFTWVYFRYRRLWYWSRENRLFMSDRELTLLAKAYTTYEAKQIVTGGYWK